MCYNLNLLLLTSLLYIQSQHCDFFSLPSKEYWVMSVCGHVWVQLWQLEPWYQCQSPCFSLFFSSTPVCWSTAFKALYIYTVGPETEIVVHTVWLTSNVMQTCILHFILYTYLFACWQPQVAGGYFWELHYPENLHDQVSKQHYVL